MTAMISSTVGGSGGYRRPLFRGGSAWWKLDAVAGDRRRPAQSSSELDSMTPSFGTTNDYLAIVPRDRRPPV
jgi:hypothetical protein